MECISALVLVACLDILVLDRLEGSTVEEQGSIQKEVDVERMDPVSSPRAESVTGKSKIDRAWIPATPATLPMEESEGGSITDESDQLRQECEEESITDESNKESEDEYNSDPEGSTENTQALEPTPVVPTPRRFCFWQSPCRQKSDSELEDESLDSTGSKSDSELEDESLDSTPVTPRKKQGSTPRTTPKVRFADELDDRLSKPSGDFHVQYDPEENHALAMPSLGLRSSKIQSVGQKSPIADTLPVFQVLASNQDMSMEQLRRPTTTIDKYCKAEDVESEEHYEYASRAIQKACRGYLARKQGQRDENASVIIQTAYRGYVAQKQVNLMITCLTEKKQREDASVTIQKASRMYLAQTQFEQMLIFLVEEEQREDASVAIQTAGRRYLAQKQFEQTLMCLVEEEQREDASVTIQKAGRRYLAQNQAKDMKKCLVEEKQREDASVTIQKAGRRYLAQKQVKRMKCLIEEEQRDYASIVIQKASRGYLVRKEVKQCDNASVVIQKVCRGLMIRKEVGHLIAEEEQCEEQDENASISIQETCREYMAVCRSYMARVQVEKLVAEEKKCEDASIVIQQSCRGYLARKQVEQLQIQAFLDRQISLAARKQSEETQWTHEDDFVKMANIAVPKAFGQMSAQRHEAGSEIQKSCDEGKAAKPLSFRESINQAFDRCLDTMSRCGCP